MNSKWISTILSLMILITFACSEHKKEPTLYTKSIKEWHNNRVDRLVNNSPWLKLAGLYWLVEGENSFGSDQSNSIIFPKDAPTQIGSFYLNNKNVTLKINEGQRVLFDSTLVTEMELKTDLSGDKTELWMENYHWYIIDREGRMGIRLIDDNHPALSDFEGIELYEPDSTWRIEADYIPYDPPKLVITPNVTGTETADSCYGKIQFEKDDEIFSFDPSPAGKGFFVIFADLTNGEETYGAGRFLYIQDSVKNGKITVDFNKAYNPPCAFTKFATCPLPPKDNFLKVKVTAGEKMYHSEWH